MLALSDLTGQLFIPSFLVKDKKLNPLTDLYRDSAVRKNGLSRSLSHIRALALVAALSNKSTRSVSLWTECWSHMGLIV